MRGYRLTGFSLLLLAACGGSPWAPDDGGGTDNGGGTPTDTIEVPASVKQQLNSATYTPGDPTITINMTSQDAAALNATYTRAAAFDVDGYQAYAYQETGSNRYVLAFVKEAGDAKGLIAYDGGQFATSHSGGTFTRATVFTAPASGLGKKFDYSGTYVGLMNIGTPLPGPGGDLNPTRSYRTTGRALITADFTEMKMSGGVDGRTIVDPMVDGAGVVDPTLDPTLMSISLQDTGITTTGTFTGKVAVFETEPEQNLPAFTLVGDYAGLFGGVQAHDISAVLFFNPYPSSNLIKEQGLIVLSNCDAVGGPACP